MRVRRTCVGTRSGDIYKTVVPLFSVFRYNIWPVGIASPPPKSLSISAKNENTQLVHLLFSAVATRALTSYDPNQARYGGSLKLVNTNKHTYKTLSR